MPQEGSVTVFLTLCAFLHLTLERSISAGVVPQLRWGNFVTDKPGLLRRAAMLLRISKNTADPELAASLVQKAADLQAQADAMGDDAPSENKSGPDKR